MRPWIRKLEGSRYQPPCQGLEGTSPSTAGPQRFDTPPYAESRRGVSRIVPCSVDVPSNVRRFLTCTLARRGALLIRARESPRFVPRVRGTNRGSPLTGQVNDINDMKNNILLILNMEIASGFDLAPMKTGLDHHMLLVKFQFRLQPERLENSINQ